MLLLDDADARLPAVARCDIASDGLEESYVPIVMDVDVPSLTLTVSIDPKANERLSRVLLLAVVMIEFR